MIKAAYITFKKYIMSKATSKGASTPEIALTLLRTKILQVLDQEKNTQAIIAAVNELKGIDGSLQYLQDNNTEFTTHPTGSLEGFE